jgi:hypothetical protein
MRRSSRAAAGSAEGRLGEADMMRLRQVCDKMYELSVGIMMLWLP